MDLTLILIGVGWLAALILALALCAAAHHGDEADQDLRREEWRKAAAERSRRRRPH